LSSRVNSSNKTTADIYLSVHIAKNDTQEPGANNYKLGISTKNTNNQSSRSLASAIAGRLKSIDIAADVADYSKVFVVSRSVHTAVLLECGNIDDQTNMDHLLNNEKLDKMCRSVLSGIVDYRQSK
jgi:N-acetylmuramoyl-L-alanine amidase